MLFHINYKVLLVLGTLIGSVGKIHEIWISEMTYNDIGAAIKILAIIVMVVFIFTDTSNLQSEDR